MNDVGAIRKPPSADTESLRKELVACIKLSDIGIDEKLALLAHLTGNVVGSFMIHVRADDEFVNALFKTVHMNILEGINAVSKSSKTNGGGLN